MRGVRAEQRAAARWASRDGASGAGPSTRAPASIEAAGALPAWGPSLDELLPERIELRLVRGALHGDEVPEVVTTTQLARVDVVDVVVIPSSPRSGEPAL